MRFIILFLFSCYTLAHSQNLVPNPSFESIKDTATNFTKSAEEFERSIERWRTPNEATPDLITNKFDERYVLTSEAHTGLMMVGILPGIRWSEYIGMSLTEALVANRTYAIEYWIKRVTCLNPKLNKNQTVNSHFGILFTSDPVYSTETEALIGSPQVPLTSVLDSINLQWVKVSYYFTPKEDFKYLYLGQFRENEQDTISMIGYFVIDDISVTEITNYCSLDEAIQLTIGSVIPLDQVQFLTGSTELKDKESSILLDDLADYLKKHPAIKIRINGHTDSKGSTKSNLLLSQQRAQAIADMIIGHGIGADRIEGKGFGEAQPIASNKTAKGRSRNRRVEFEVIE